MIIQFENGTQIAILAVSTLFATLAAASVGMRFYARRLKQAPVKADDWCILVALVSTNSQNSSRLAANMSQILALGLVACDMTGRMFVFWTWRLV
jgi:hypothetical protein